MKIIRKSSIIHMINIKEDDIVGLETHLHFENEGVLNPATIHKGDSFYLFYRGRNTSEPQAEQEVKGKLTDDQIKTEKNNYEQ